MSSDTQIRVVNIKTLESTNGFARYIAMWAWGKDFHNLRFFVEGIGEVKPELQDYSTDNLEKALVAACKSSLEKVRDAVRIWLDKQDQEKCWYYPAIFDQICKILGVDNSQMHVCSLQDFRAGCDKYTKELFGDSKSPLDLVKDLVLMEPEYGKHLAGEAERIMKQ